MRHPLTHSSQLPSILASRRRALGLSQAQLAQKLGISQNRLSEIETGKAALTLERLVDLLNVLGLELVVQDRQPGKTAW